MKATIVLIVAVALAMVALAAEPVAPAVVSQAAAALSFEPIWMVLSGAALLVIASVVRRFFAP